MAAKERYMQPDRGMRQRGQKTELLDNVVRLQHKPLLGFSRLHSYQLLSSVVISDHGLRDNRY